VCRLLAKKVAMAVKMRATPTTQEERQNPATQQPMAFQPSNDRSIETMNHPRAM
jgi:hypothetical protein